MQPSPFEGIHYVVHVRLSRKILPLTFVVVTACSGGGVSNLTPAPVVPQAPSGAQAPALGVPATSQPNVGTNQMSAGAADDFVASMGVDVDLVTPPDTAQATIAARFAGLGVRHTRIPVLEPNGHYEGVVRGFFAANPSVSAYGLTACKPPLGPYPRAAISPQDVRDFQSAIGGHLDSIEAVNEPDNAGDVNWVADARSCIAPLVNALPSVPLVGPALITRLNGTSQKALGDTSSLASIQNVHRYFAGRNPDTPGFGAADACGVYGALTWAVCWAHFNGPNQPVVVTETGWNSAAEVDELTQAKYVERLFFVNAQAGIAATSLYVLEDYAGDAFGGTGLIRTDFSPKPAYKAIANITQLLTDPGPHLQPLSLPLMITPAPVPSGLGLRAMVLGKHDGSYDIALWQEVQSANPDHRGVDTIPEPVNVTLTLITPWNGTLHAWQDDGSAPASALGLSKAFTVPVTDRLSIVELRL